MERITFEDYRKFGGIHSHSDFSLLIVDTESFLQKITFNRIDNVELTDKIKRCIVKLVDFKDEQSNNNIKSFSDSIDSITFDDAKVTEKKKDICKIYLDNDLLYRGVYEK